MERGDGDRLVESVRRTGARARWVRAVERVASAGLGLVALGAIVAAARSLLWPRGDLDPALVGLPRAAILCAAASLLATLAYAAWVYWRARPAPLSSARTIDAHLGLADVIASALAFRDEGTPGPAAALTRQRADAGLAGFDPRAAIPGPRLRPRPRRLALATLAVGAGLALGTLDSTVVAALVAPPTPSERRAADALEEAARELEAEAEERAREEASRARPPDPSRRDDDRALAAQARQVAAATRRGDRDAALRALRELEAGRERESRRARRDHERLSSLASALGAPARPSGRDRTPSAAERAREMERLLRRREEEPASLRPEAQREAERERMLDRLERAAQRARQRGEDALSEALRRAAQALGARDDAGAAEAMQQASQALEQMEAELAEARIMLARRARLAERAGDAERALQMARMGRDGEGDEADAMMLGEHGRGGEDAEGPSPGGRALSATIMNRLTALGLAQGPSDDPRGPGGPRRTGAPQPRLDPQGDAHARSQVDGVGEQAIAVLEGLGRNGDPTTELRDVYPTYGVQVEEALADERVPAARRRTVRRYFESIRPDADREEEPR